MSQSLAPRIETLTRRRPLVATARSYLALTKPRVIELLLVTAVPPMILAAEGLPSAALVAVVVVGGALGAGGANTINCWIERERDRLMERTHDRPLPAGEVVPGHALTFGIALNGVAFALLWSAANLLAAALTLFATLFYVFVYTIWLKPRTDQNIVVGGAAGAVPALVGWAAVDGTLAAPAWVLFTVVFLWTPAHFWALALRYRDDYARAGVPMLPVVRGVQATVRHIAGYALATVLVTLTLPAVSEVGALYLGAAVVLGTSFVFQAVRLRGEATPARALRFFMFSNLYLMLVFTAVALDTLLLG